MRILKVNIYRGNVYVKAQNNANPTSVVLYCPFCGSNGEFERFGGFYVDCYSRYNRRQGRKVWQAVAAKSRSSFKSSSNRLLTLASCKSSMLRLEKGWASVVKRWLSLVWEASVLASEVLVSR